MPPKTKYYTYQVVETSDFKNDEIVKYFFTIPEVSNYLKVSTTSVLKWLNGDCENKKRPNITIFRGKFPVYETFKKEYPENKIE